MMSNFWLLKFSFLDFTILSTLNPNLQLVFFWDRRKYPKFDPENAKMAVFNTFWAFLKNTSCDQLWLKNNNYILNFDFFKMVKEFLQ